MFFFFFDELYNIPEVKEAFFAVIGTRLLNYGYFDMTVIMHDAVSEKNEIRG